MKRTTFAAKVLSATAAFCLILPSMAAPQSKTSDAGVHKLLAVKVTGATRYTDKEILAASGLELGQNAAEGNFQEATQRLGNSGLFAEIQYSFSYSDAGVKLEFKLTDIDKSKFVPVHFENFVWFTEPELRTALAQRVPLFKDAVPAGGKLPDQLNRALQAFLEEHHFPGHVDYLREARPDGGDITGIVYRVLDISIHIRRVEFPGASPDQIAFLASAANKLAGADYSRSMLAAVARLDLLPLFLQRGYLKAAFGPADARLVAPSAAAEPVRGQAQDESKERPSDEIEVDAIVPVTPGKQYSVSEVSWKGNTAVATEEAVPLLHLPLGQPADAVRLGRDLETLTRLYRSRGYMTVHIKPDPQMDDDKATVRYVIDIAEGPLYTMGELEIAGVDTTSKDRLREAWTLREGQPYNADYTRKFLETAPRLLPKGLRYSIKLSEDLDAKNKIVDVTIHFLTQ
jgi:Surface antigen variable number repeat